MPNRSSLGAQLGPARAAWLHDPDAGSGSFLDVAADQAGTRVIAERGIRVRRCRCRALRRVCAPTVHLRREYWEMIRQSASPPKARHHAVNAPGLELHPRSCPALHGLTRAAYPTRWSAGVSAPARACIGRLRRSVTKVVPAGGSLYRITVTATCPAQTAPASRGPPFNDDAIGAIQWT
jgi:hypothetical protein